MQTVPQAKRQRRATSTDLAQLESLGARELAVSKREAAVKMHQRALQRAQKALSKRETALKKHETRLQQAQKTNKNQLGKLRAQLTALAAERDGYVKLWKDKEMELAGISSSRAGKGLDLQWILEQLEEQYQCSL